MNDQNLPAKLDLNNPPERAQLLEMASQFSDFKLPSMPLFIDDFIGDTLDLDAKEIGAYMLILMALWRRNCEPIPIDKLARVARVPRFPAIWKVLQPYFRVQDGAVYNRKLESVWRYVFTKSLINRHAGRLGGSRKSLKDIDTPPSGAGSGAKATHSQLQEKVSKDTSSCSTPAKKRRSASRALPEDFVPDLERAGRLKEEFDLTREEMNFCYQQMKGHAHATDRRQADWNAAFANWIRKAVQDGEIGPKSRGRKGKLDRDPAFD